MSVRVINAQNKQLWPSGAEHNLSSLFSSPLWIETLTRTYGFEILASTFTWPGEIQDAVLFSHVSDLRGERIVCLPFSDYCDPLVQDAEAWQEAIKPILALSLPVTLRCLRNEIPVNDSRFATVGRLMWHSVDLRRSEEELWAGFSGSARQNVRKAERSGVVVREARSLEAVRVFHRMHCHVRKSKYRLFAQPAAFFDNLYQIFGVSQLLTVLLAEVDGFPIAGVFYLEWGDTLYYKFNASVDQRYCPNDLLAWEGIRLGQRRGLAHLDFGVSDPVQLGLIRYKRKYATQERSVSVLRWQPPDHVNMRGDRVGRMFNRITQLLTDPAVPDEITRAAGDELYRYFC
jgi:CelD/BcsL family acetyltransferase involved in cellulose biosynthesis